MPHLDGAKFEQSLRHLPTCSDVPVIVVTAYEDRGFRYDALNAGATDFLLSPVDHEEFRARARNMLTLRFQQSLLKRRRQVIRRPPNKNKKSGFLEAVLGAVAAWSVSRRLFWARTKQSIFLRLVSSSSSAASTQMSMMSTIS